MAIPIIYIFSGWEPYLELSVRQAKQYNPDSPIYHVTGADSRVAEGAIHIDDSLYRGWAARFERSYKHLSINPKSFELFCFQRWMIAYEMMFDLDMEEAVLMDGDVLLWTSLEETVPFFRRWGMTWTEPDQPGTVFVTNRDTLRDLCESMLAHYETEEGFARVNRDYDSRVAEGRPPAITDMALLGYFKEDHPGQVGDNSRIVEGGRYDHAMYESDGFVLANGLKQFEWKDGLPYGVSVDDGSLVKFHSMHFVGRTKGYMTLYSQGKNLTTLGKVVAAPKWVRARVPSVIRKLKGYVGT